MTSVRHTFSSVLRTLGISMQGVVLCLTDTLVVYAASSLAAFLCWSAGGTVTLSGFVALMPGFLGVPLLGVVFGTCQTIALPPPTELKMVSLATFITFLLLFLFLFVDKKEGALPTQTLPWAALACAVAVPFARGYVRAKLCNADWWCRPVVLIGHGQAADDVWASLIHYPERGLRPVVQVPNPFVSQSCVLHEDMQPDSSHPRHVPEPNPESNPESEINPLEQAASKVSAISAQSAALVVLEGFSVVEATAVLKHASRLFRSVLVIPQFTLGSGQLWLAPRDLGYMAGFLVRQNLLDPRRLRFKRCLDIFLALLLAIPALPAALCISAGLWLSGKGSIITRHECIGKNGRTIRIARFRVRGEPSLVTGVQAESFDAHTPSPSGLESFLHRSGLAGIPSLWNVLRGDMTFVGPRPVTREYLDKHAIFDEYTLVKPGLTGLWYITGGAHSQRGKRERFRLDQYYASNWSVWFDIWVLSRTLGIVFGGDSE